MLRKSAALMLSIWLLPSVAHAATCEGLVKLALPTAAVTLAQSVPAGGLVLPPDVRAALPPSTVDTLPSLAPFCRITATLRPSPRSDVRIEVWLPASGWNGKLQVVGNGGFAGRINYAGMATALAAGYATGSTDTGHTGPSSNTFVNEDVLVDFAHRAIHETTIAAKKIVDAFFGRAARFSYFNGCSTGGRQALTEAQRYPEDFDGIVAGAPASHTTTQTFGQIWIHQAMTDAAGALPREKLTLVHDAVMAACDARDGVKDGVLENPLACTFDPQALACKDGADAAACLTPPQVAAVQKIYAGATNTKTGAPIFPGFERGSEPGWSPVPVGYAVDYFKHIVFKDPNWDPKTLNFDSHLELMSKPENQIFDARSEDISRFTRRGGKLLMYQGWAEPGIPPRNLVTYYEKVQATSAGAKDSVRVFMVPGMGHCGGGNGTSTFDMVTALDRWLTTGTPPARINASRVREGKVDRTRPLCPWPQVATYKGAGSIDEESSFACANP